MTGSDVSVFVLEDNERLRRLYGMWLSGLVDHYEVASHGNECIEKCGPDFDIGIIDLHVPGLSGMKLVGEIHEKCPNMDIVIVSGDLSSPSEGVDERMKRDYITDYVVKPVEKPDIVKIIDELGA